MDIGYNHPMDNGHMVSNQTPLFLCQDTVFPHKSRLPSRCTGYGPLLMPGYKAQWSCPHILRKHADMGL